MNEGKNEVSTSAAGRLRPCPLMCDGQQACVSRAPECGWVLPSTACRNARVAFVVKAFLSRKF
ncbi:hypothetical protein BVL39_07895 [Escherichia coli]|uniref:Trimetoprim dihydrofolate reductase n=3 Tax=Enterobacteriaceae TaxID=543 RepID=B6DYX1_ECOLX|nr:trimetoprim dihydrofolate reductase [Escherichia coli]ARO45965.1 hypothetical protein [Klebsiella pneumoniae]AWW21955.1 trimetoprim dihydrofolate reductase [Salmonella enterica subsp. enterica serovar Indiana]QKY88350.1 hypothetical protein [Salmonella enterica subsp. enterica serovar Thompson]AGE98048.1 trimetoprim dihydrofolate reductase [Escherichia coli]